MPYAQTSAFLTTALGLEKEHCTSQLPALVQLHQPELSGCSEHLPQLSLSHPWALTSP